MSPSAIAVDFDFGSAGLLQGHAERFNPTGPHAPSRFLAVYDVLDELLIKGKGVFRVDQRDQLLQAREFLVVLRSGL